MTTPTQADPELIRQLRQEYRRAGLTEDDVAAEPFAQFARWFGEAVRGELREPNAMTVATIAPSMVSSNCTMRFGHGDTMGMPLVTIGQACCVPAVSHVPPARPSTPPTPAIHGIHGTLSR